MQETQEVAGCDSQVDQKQVEPPSFIAVGQRKSRTVRITDAAYLWLQAEAEERQLCVSDMIAEAIWLHAAILGDGSLSEQKSRPVGMEKQKLILFKSALKAVNRLRSDWARKAKSPA